MFEDDFSLSLYFRDLNDYDALKEGEEESLAQAIATGDRPALDRMIVANLPLVVTIARDFQGRGLPLADLIGEGNLGLMRAAESFDPSEGTKFSTYAGYWIKAAIRRALKIQPRYLRIPSWLIKVMRDWRIKSSELAAELGQEPAADAVATALGLSKRRTKLLFRGQQARALNRVPEDDEGEGFSLDGCPDSNAPDGQLQIAKEDAAEQILILVSQLPKRSRNLLSMRFGLDPFPPMRISEIAEVLGLTGTRVRQLQSEALAEVLRGALLLETHGALEAAG